MGIMIVFALLLLQVGYQAVKPNDRKDAAIDIRGNDSYTHADVQGESRNDPRPDECLH